MAENSGIDWTDHSWNPWQGCRKVSPGCLNCYMYRDKKRYGQDPKTVIRSKPDTFNSPLKWQDPAKIFVCSWSDFFIEDADPWRDDAWEIIRKCPQHTFQILTKRPENIKDRLPNDWPLPNVWMGVTAENQEMADKRIPLLLEIPAAIRFVSIEPMLGPINLENLSCPEHLQPHWAAGDDLYKFNALDDDDTRHFYNQSPSLDLVICGGETGPRARPVHPDGVRSLRDQCQAAGVPFFFKQWGEFVPAYDAGFRSEETDQWKRSFGQAWAKSGKYTFDDCEPVVRVGKKKAGYLLDGKEYREFPK